MIPDRRLVIFLDFAKHFFMVETFLILRNIFSWLKHFCIFTVQSFIFAEFIFAVHKTASYFTEFNFLISDYKVMSIKKQISFSRKNNNFIQ